MQRKNIKANSPNKSMIILAILANYFSKLSSILSVLCAKIFNFAESCANQVALNDIRAYSP